MAIDGIGTRTRTHSPAIYNINAELEATVGDIDAHGRGHPESLELFDDRHGRLVSEG